MLHVVTVHNQHLYARQLDAMFRMRYEFYIKQRQWNDLKHDSERETDEYDNEDAVYLMYLDARAELVASVRLLPTINGDLLEKLPHYVDGSPPQRSVYLGLHPLDDRASCAAKD